MTPPASIRTKVICAAGLVALEEATRTLDRARTALARGDQEAATALYRECQEIAEFVGDLFLGIWPSGMASRREERA